MVSAWDYPRVLAIMEDSRELPSTYDEFRKMFEAGERKLKSAGHIVVRATIEPDEFLAWCREKGMKANTDARLEFANEAAYQATAGQR